MIAITIKQPWAYLIAAGIKDIENRTWPTKFRGRVLVHAAAKSWLWHKVLQYLSPALKEFATKNNYILSNESNSLSLFLIFKKILENIVDGFCTQ